MTKEKQSKTSVQKLCAGIVTFALALAMMCTPMFTQKVNAQEQVKIEITYIYVNNAGNNSMYVDTQYVPTGTNWGEFFNSYNKCYQNGTITNANGNNAWEFDVQNVKYSSEDQYYSKVIKNFNQYTDCAYVTFYGLPSDYKHANYAFSYYHKGQFVDAGTNYHLLIPKAYAYGSEQAIAYAKENIKMHEYITRYCNIPGAKVEFTAPYQDNDGTKWDGYIVNITTDSDFSSVSGNVPQRQPQGQTPSTDNNDGEQVPAIQETPSDVVQGSNGKQLISTVGGVYTVKSVNGVAVTTPKNEVALAAGASEEDIKNGDNVRFYVCEGYDAGAKNELKSAAEKSGKKIMSIINMDLYRINKQGKVAYIRNTTAPVSMVIGVPASMQNAGHTFSVICMVNGQPVVMEDMDSDPMTITINTNTFGSYAIVY